MWVFQKESPVKSILMLQKGSNVAQSDPEKVLLMINDVPGDFFLNFGVGACQKWCSKKLWPGTKNLPKP